MTAKRSTARKSTATRARKAAAASRSSRTTRSATAKRTTRAQDAIALLKADHREVEKLFARYARLSSGATKSKKDLVQRIVRELSIHSTIEEQVLYPQIRVSLPNGNALTDEAVQEHKTVAETLVQLDGMAVDDEQLDPLMRAVIQDVRHHVKEEETELFPGLREHVERSRLADMGDAMRALKKTAPTRPHPRTPTEGPVGLVTGLAAGLVDRVRDAGRGIRERVS